MKRTKRTTSTTRLELDGLNIIDALRKSGLNIPDGATVAVRIPGGGDYSNMMLDVDAHSPLVVEFTESHDG